MGVLLNCEARVDLTESLGDHDMNDPQASRSTRGRDAGKLSGQLRHSREVMDRRRALERRREQNVSAAVRQYWSAWQAISTIEQRRDRRIRALHDKIRHLEEAAATDIAVHRTRQAAAVVRMNEHGCSTDDIAELLEISVRGARQLLAAGQEKPEPGVQAAHRESGQRLNEPQRSAGSAEQSP
ncbi:hypothetical protein [Nocardia africana]|uniref:hypothetical protein n=1 Tax=Nocardia africana TaxID=134964 RepID=UPI0012F4E435|nr:hypothetical protein [Nocardia africana]MCC3318247.1 hypothetical protein [Nocardia africana]